MFWLSIFTWLTHCTIKHAYIHRWCNKGLFESENILNERVGNVYDVRWLKYRPYLKQNWTESRVNIHSVVTTDCAWHSFAVAVFYIPSANEASRAVANLTEIKNPHTPLCGVKEFVCLSVCLWSTLTPIIASQIRCSDPQNNEVFYNGPNNFIPLQAKRVLR